MTIAENRIKFSLSLSAIYMSINFQPNDKWLQIERQVQYIVSDSRWIPRVQGRVAIKKWRRIGTMCMLAYESRSAYCLRHGGTCYISHSRWHDDVTRRCAESSSCSFINNDPRRARLLGRSREAQLTVPLGISRNSSSSPLAQFSAPRIVSHTAELQTLCLYQLCYSNKMPINFSTENR